MGIFIDRAINAHAAKRKRIYAIKINDLRSYGLGDPGPERICIEISCCCLNAAAVLLVIAFKLQFSLGPIGSKAAFSEVVAQNMGTVH